MNDSAISSSSISLRFCNSETKQFLPSSLVIEQFKSKPIMELIKQFQLFTFNDNEMQKMIGLRSSHSHDRTLEVSSFAAASLVVVLKSKFLLFGDKAITSNALFVDRKGNGFGNMNVDSSTKQTRVAQQSFEQAFHNFNHSLEVSPNNFSKR